MVIFRTSTIAVILALSNLTIAKIYKKCELAKELSKVHGIAWEDVATYTCIAEKQSNFNTQAVGEGQYFGIYQISSEFWCDNNSVGKACKLRCNNLLDDDLSDDLNCMKTIIDEHQRISGNGYNAWPSGRQCQSLGTNYISECSIESNQVHSTYNNNNYKKATPQQKKTSGNVGRGKVYERCELAQELRYKYNIQMDHIATWVCIAKHESNFNTSAIGRLNWDGSEDHGLFQISDIYWCGHDGKVCGLSCDELEDNDISNDVECIKTIHAEHTRLFGDGFQAWAVYPRCKDQSEIYISGCFDDSDNEVIPVKTLPGIQQPTKPRISHHRSDSSSFQTGKVYDRCELALELRDKHNLPINQIATWVCIAKHESNFNTSAVGRLNWDGSEDHGLFQISDIYWCGGVDGKGCKLSCDDLKDNDISNDVECIKTIHAEHTRLFGDGFQAWAVYPRCKDQSEIYISGCFDDSDNEILPFTPLPGIQQPKVTYSKIFIERKQHKKVPEKGKVYDRCELAQELRFKHKIPMEQVSTWVCIAKHESNFNTSAIGRLNLDGSEDHGLFQISDIYWCTTSGQGKGCNMPCSDLEDSDITDDVECMLKIHEEHTFLSGDGFNAWAVYKPHCKGRAESYISGCFNDEENFIQNVKPGVTQPTKPLTTSTKKTTQAPTKVSIKYRPTTTSTKAKSIKTISNKNHITELPITTENYIDTTVYETTNSPIKYLLTTIKNIPTKKSTQQKQSTNNLSTTIRSNSFYGSSTSKSSRKLNEQTTYTSTTTNSNTSSKSSFTKSTSINLKSLTTTKTKPLTTSSLMTFTSTTQKPITQSLTTTQKSITPFNIFAFYLKDFTSKASPILYQPIKFSDKSTIIFKKTDTSTNAHSLVTSSTSPTTTSLKTTTQLNSINDESHKVMNNLKTTTKSLPIYNLIPSHYISNGIDHNRIGRVVSNITPHSFDYLLKLTTPRTFYG